MHFNPSLLVISLPVLFYLVQRLYNENYYKQRSIQKELKTKKTKIKRGSSENQSVGKAVPDTATLIPPTVTPPVLIDTPDVHHASALTYIDGQEMSNHDDVVVDSSLSSEPHGHHTTLKTTARSIIIGSVLKKGAKKRLFVKPLPAPIEKPLTSFMIREAYQEYIGTCHHYHDILPIEKQKDVSRRTSYIANLAEGQRPPTPERLKRAEPPHKTNYHPIFPFCYKRLLLLQVQLPSIFLNVKQLMMILELLPAIDYLRVMVIQSAFNRIVDLENFHWILETDYANINNVHCPNCAMTTDEIDEIYHRLGILNVCDPMHPDRLFKLDLRRWEHREWCKILIQLAINEPGENWVDVSYSWSRYDDPVPGWELPQPWAEPDSEGSEFSKDTGPRRYGWLVVMYRSVGFGCQVTDE